MKKAKVKSNYLKEIILILSFILFILLSFLYFMYYVLAIASGSMNPVFDRGSVVIIEQVNDKYDNYNKLKEGKIIADFL